jgi:parvulin-like peptidyl-prolyl isomerase
MFIENQYPAFLGEQIMIALIYNDFLGSKSREEREFLMKKLGDDFDANEVPLLLKDYNLQNLPELKLFLSKQLGSSLDRERMLWIRFKIAQEWRRYNVQSATGNATHDEMMEFYKAHLDMFTTEARVEWKELFTAFANHPSEKEALNKIAWMGNQVAAGHSFENIARANSEGFTASEGGHWKWTKRGVLSSAELEKNLFTLPVGTTNSPIIKSEKGFHIVCVTKREETVTVPFIEAQVKIREQIKMQRRKNYEEKYMEELKRKYPTSILREKIDFRTN